MEIAPDTFEPADADTCWFCQKGEWFGPMEFSFEFDCYVHERCIEATLESDPGHERALEMALELGVELPEEA